MTALIRHFGDTADATRSCGHCDVCAPGAHSSQSFRAPTPEDLRQLVAILTALDPRQAGGPSRSTGKLFTELSNGALRGTPAGRERRTFDTLLDALTRAGLLLVTQDTFTNPEGSLITYKKAALTYEGLEAASTGKLHTPDLLLKDTMEAPAPATKTRARSAAKAVKQDRATAYTPSQKSLEIRLREWRKAEAAKTGKPAFLVFSDNVLNAIVLGRPNTLPELLQLPGIGPRIADVYGASILSLCRGDDSLVEPATARSPKLRQISLSDPTPVSPAGWPRSAGRSTSMERPQPVAPTDPTALLTPEQQDLDHRLREWRRSEAERLGLPQFFVLGSSTLRSIVLERPGTLAALQKINGIGLEKVEKYGPGILAVCTS